MAGGAKISIGDLARGLNALSAELETMTELLADAVWEWAPLQVMENFERGQSEWAPLKAATLAQRAARGNPSTNILEDTLALEGSLVNSREQAVRIEGKNRVVYGTDIPYAHQHQYGLPERHIPKRPFMPSPAQTSGFAEVMKQKLSDLVGYTLGITSHTSLPSARAKRISKRTFRRNAKKSARQISRRGKQ